MSQARFPRTAHIVNGPLQGAAVTRDDLLVDKSEQLCFVSHDAAAAVHGAAVQPVLTLEEKVDGANLGLFLDPDTLALVCQNRSHVVHGESGTLWQALPRFLDEHRAELNALLYGLGDSAAVRTAVAANAARGPATQGKPEPHTFAATEFVLYGEWMALVHSITYDRLPSLFIAFDILHAPTQTFLATPLRDALLAEHAPSIAVVPAVHRGSLPSTLPAQEAAAIVAGSPSPAVRALLDKGRKKDKASELWAVVHARWHKHPSAFSKAAAAMEGVVLRLEDAATGTLLRRSKAVHDEFTQGIDEAGHWRRQAPVKNTVCYGE